jgi:hypothetical protein
MAGDGLDPLLARDAITAFEISRDLPFQRFRRSIAASRSSGEPLSALLMPPLSALSRAWILGCTTSLQRWVNSWSEC